MVPEFPAARQARRNGRPTREAAKHLHEELLVRALEMFAESGFELTSLDAIAASLNMTKRTIYRKYGDKESFFKACVQRGIDKYNAQVNIFADCGGDVETTLLNVAQVRSKHTASREGVILRRVIHAESVRFPDIYEAYQASATPALDFLVRLFEHHAGGELAPHQDWRVTAMSFLGLVATPIRMVILGKQPNMEEIDAFVRQSVALFLNGIRVRNRADQPGEGGDRSARLEHENSMLKTMLADAMLENARLREVAG